MARSWSFLLLLFFLSGLIHGSDIETQLLEAATEGNVGRMQRLLDKGADVNTTDSDGLTPMMRAVWYENAEAVRFLLNAGADFNQKDAFGQTALVYGVENGDEKIVRVLLDTGANPNDTNEKGNPLLIAALSNQSTEVAIALIDAGANVSSETADGQNPLKAAARAGFTDLVATRIKKGADVNAASGGLSALMEAARRNNLETAEVLLEYGADVNNRSESRRDSGETALMVAAEKGHSKMVKKLIAAGAEIDIKDDSGDTALIKAMEGGRAEMVRQLLHAGADPTIKDREGRNAYLIAVKEEEVEILKLLIEAGVDIESTDNRGTNGLIHSSSEGDTEIAEILISAGANINVVNEYGRSALSEAAERGYTGIVRLLVDAGADVNLRDADGKTALMRAATGGKTEAVRILLDAKADFNLQDDKKLTALMLSAKRGEETVVKLLLEAGADPGLKDDKGKTAFIHALAEGHLGIAALLGGSGIELSVLSAELISAISRGKKPLPEIVKILIDAGADVNAREERGALKTALMIASRKGFADVVKLLLEAGAEVDAKDDVGLTAFSDALGEAHFEIVDMLKKAGVHMDQSRLDGYLNHVAGQGDTQKVKAVIARGADVNSGGNFLTLTAAVSGNHIETIHVLLQAGVDVNKRGRDGKTALFYASEKSHIDAVFVLLEAGADVNARNRYGQTALFFALEESQTEAVLVLLESGAEVKIKDAYGKTPLHIALMKFHYKVIRPLIEAGADVNIRIKDGQTPLIFAVEHSGVDLVRLILLKGADVAAKDSRGYTALRLALRRDRPQIVSSLREAGAEVPTELIAWDLVSAARERYGSTLSNLLSSGVDVNLEDPGSGCTALHAAAEVGQNEAIGILLEAGADVAAADRLRGWTPLIAASVGNHLDGVRLLLAAGADVNQRDRDWGWTALMHAALNGHHRIVDHLLASGADVEAKDRDWGWRALTIAAKSGHTEIMSTLLEAGAEVNVRDRNGWTPLVWAAYENRVQTTEILLKNGAATDTSDVHGRTALIIAERLAHAEVVRQILNVQRKDTVASEIDRLGGLKMVIQSSHPTATSVAFSRDGRYLASGGIDNTIKLWAADGRLIRTMTGHRDSVTCVAFVSDGDHLASGSLDGTVKIWSLNGELVRDITVSSGGVNDLSVHPDGKHLAVAADRPMSGTREHTLMLWRLEGQMVRSFEGDMGDVKTAAVSPDGTYIASSGDGNTVYLWKTNGDLVHTLEGHSGTVTRVAFSPDGSMIVSAGLDGKVNLWSVDGKRVWSIEAHSGAIRDICFSTDGGYIFSAGSHKDRGSIMVWSLTGELVRVIEDDSSALHAIDLGADGKIASAGGGASIKLWSSSGELIKAIRGQERSEHYFTDISYSPDGKQIRSKNWGESWSKAATWSNDGRLIQSRVLHFDSERDTSDGEAQDGSSSLEQKLRNSADWRPGGYRFISSWCRLEEDPDSLYFATIDPLDEYCTIVLWKADLIPAFSSEKFGRISEMILDERGRTTHIETTADNENRDIETWRLKCRRIRIIDYRLDELREVIVSGYGKHIAGIGKRAPNIIKLWDFEGRPLKTLKMPVDEIADIAFSSDGKSVAGVSLDGTIAKWSIATGDYMVLLGFGDEWIMYTPDGYFDSSRRGGELVSMVRGLTAFSPDQFALRYNRPDIVLKRLDYSRNETIQHFYLQYIKRLVKSKILPKRIERSVFEGTILSALSKNEDRQFLLSNYEREHESYMLVEEPSLRDRYRLFSLSPFLEHVERELGTGMHVPEVKILESKQDGKFFDLHFKLRDRSFELDSYNVYVNDVPVFGSRGKRITGRNVIITERVELNPGNNKIEVSCMNDRLVESFREQRFAAYDKTVKSDVYFIGFGVSKYKNPDLNLVYPNKDVRDLRQLFVGMKGHFDSIHVHAFVDENCTTSNIRKAKRLLENASVDDSVVLFISGHGMHSKDPEAIYYFLTHEADVDNLSQTAANFDLIEDILDAVKPRFKLFLMDTCESGELDEEIAQVYLKDASEMGLQARTPKGFSAQTKRLRSEPRRTYLLERERYIYNDVFRRTGALVFSSSRGGEFSYEPESYTEEGNGFFTGAFIESIKGNRADRDGDGFVTTDEMREYVTKAVTERTKGLQNPTVDRDNIYVKFGFPAVD